MSQIHDVIEVEVIGNHRLKVVFDDGEVRTVDLADHLHGPVFEPLKDQEKFAQVRVDPELGTITWPTGADLDPIVIYRGLPPLYPARS